MKKKYIKSSLFLISLFFFGIANADYKIMINKIKIPEKILTTECLYSHQNPQTRTVSNQYTGDKYYWEDEYIGAGTNVVKDGYKYTTGNYVTAGNSGITYRFVCRTG